MAASGQLAASSAQAAPHDHRSLSAALAQAALGRIESSIQSVSAGVGAFPVTSADPETCWLMGAFARAEGKAAQLAEALGGTGSAWSTCLVYTQRGALGQDFDGN